MTKRQHAAAHAKAPAEGRGSGFGARLPLHENVSVATLADIGPVMGLIAKGAAEGKLVPRDRDEVAADIRVGCGFAYRHGRELAGITFLSIYSGALAEIRSFYVEERHRENGAGRALIESVLATARNLGIREVLAITKQDNEGWFSRFGFVRRNGFQTALFRKRDSAVPGPDVENATIHDRDAILELMAEGEARRRLIPRTVWETLVDITEGNAFVCRRGGSIAGMAFLAAYSKRLAEIRNVYARVEEAESALVGSVAARSDELGINETMAIVRNGGSHEWSAFAKAGFAPELHGFRTALFASTTENPVF